jgi:hypothetical protein
MSFKSYEYTKHLDFDQKTNKYRYEYKIIDDEYKIIDDDWVAVGVAVGVRLGVAFAIAVIQEYSKRDLPVAPNLFRAFQWFSKKYGCSIEQIIAWNQECNPKFKQYEEDIEKYLVLL